MYPDGKDYNGKLSVTAMGLTCQRWDSQKPHSHTLTADDFPDKSLTLAANYCRNPGGQGTAPWCYTTNPEVEMEYCKIPRCQEGNMYLCRLNVVLKMSVGDTRCLAIRNSNIDIALGVVTAKKKSSKCRGKDVCWRYQVSRNQK